MRVTDEGALLRIYLGEADRHGRQPLYQWLLEQAHAQGIAGATVLRGVEGFGATSRIHKARVLRLSTDLPVVLEIVDSRERIEAFLPVVEGALTSGMATVETVRLLRRGQADEPA
jgi:PII-like signaling protein